MPQETNLNVSPYFDDFNEDKNFNRVLFKPSTPVQARELNQLQSILQGQIEQFGKHFFKEGSQVIPGQVAFDPAYQAVELSDTFFGIQVSEYVDKLVGKVIVGAESGVEAKVVNYLTPSQSERGTNTLYVKYTKSADDFAGEKFLDGENLSAKSDIEYGLSRITANNPFASCVPSGATSTGSAAAIQEGVYFIRGFFVKVQSGTVVLDQYTNKPTARVGLLISENVVTAYQDDSLFDNAAGYSNFSAPGADRFQIKTTLIKKDIDDVNDENFVELIRLKNGIIEKFVAKTDYNIIQDELARRTFDESGDYYIDPFQVVVRESLNDNRGNNGVYQRTQKTANGGTPSKDLMVYKVSPGKAYVRGYEIQKITSTLIDVPKPRTVKTVENGTTIFNGTSQTKLFNVHGSPVVGFGTTATLSLRSQLTNTNGTAAGIEIGNAKVYDFKLEAAAYADGSTKYDLSLYDLQTFTVITVNTDQTLTTPVHVKGSKSGATAFLKNNVSSSKSLTLTDTTGIFLKDESLILNGIQEPVTITSVREYGIGDIKSLHQTVGINTFTADLVHNNIFDLSSAGAEFTIATNGTVTTPGNKFSAGIKTGDLVAYSVENKSDITFNRVSALSSDGSTITIVGLGQSVSGVYDGGLTTTQIKTSDFYLVKPGITNAGQGQLVSTLPSPYISNVSLDNASIEIRKQYTLNVSSNKATVSVNDASLFFLPFDEERYNLVYSDGTIESLTDKNVVLNATSKSVSLVGLSKASDTNALLITSLKKIDVQARTKNISRCSKLTVNRSKYESSGSTNTSTNNGLTYNTVYGTRVEDNEISLNVPDGITVHAIFESSTTSAPTIPSITLVNKSADLTEAIQGEFVTGSTSGAVARVVTRTASKVEIVYQNELRFEVGESAFFEESGINGEVSISVLGDKNISTEFTFDNGQRPEYYDYCRLIRNSDAQEPQRQITVVFDHYVIDSSTSGDITTVNSYPTNAYDEDIPFIDGIPATDLIDVRPRVKNYNPASDTDSPFEYDFRDFSSGSVNNIILPDSPLILDYSYYLGRVDKLLLNRDGFFEVRQGAPSENPVAPAVQANSFLVATLYHRPYTRNARFESKSRLSNHKRYTMFDISRLEKRLSNVEFYTQLSLLEAETSNLVIKDPDTGLDKFKSGFFVDNFTSHSAHDISSPIFKASIDKKEGELRPSHFTTGLDLLIGSEQVVGIGTTANPNADLTTVSDLQSNSLQKTGDLITLKYTETPLVEQKFATSVENVNPFAVINWVGVVDLNPDSDIWIDEKTLDVNNVEEEGNYQAFMDSLQIDPNTGLSPIDWNAWEETWSSTDVTSEDIDVELVDSKKKVGKWKSGFKKGGKTTGSGQAKRHRKITVTDTYETTSLETTTVTTGLEKTGVQYKVTETFDTKSLGTSLVNTTLIPYMRSRNIEFVSNRIKPKTQFYIFFDGEDVTKYCTPKLLEITMDSGVFQVGEKVTGKMKSESNDGIAPEISFRVADPNHKYGSYDNPEITYAVNPYAPSTSLGENYSATSTVLNVDTGSLQLQVLGDYFGYVSKGMKITGQTSGAQAVIKDVRLITDEKGVLIGTFFIPDGVDATTAPQFTTGTKAFRVTSSIVNSLSPTENPSTAETTFKAEGTLNTFQETIVTTKNAKVETISHTDSTTVSSQTQKIVKTESFDEKVIYQNQWYDPLAESFQVVDETGVFITSAEVFFKSKDTEIPVTAQIRTMQTGLPTNTIVAFGERILEPEQVKLSDNGSVPTKFTFPSPVYLPKGEYALVLLSASNDYEVFISVMGEADITTADLPEGEQTIISQQPYMGSLFKSQNGSTWTPAQFEDLKFNLYQAKFVQGPGTLKLYNPKLGDGVLKNAVLKPNPLSLSSQEILVSLGATVITRDFSVGSRLTQVSNTSAKGHVVKSLGQIKINTSATEAGGITTNSVGTGLTPAASNYTYTGIALTTITGNGSGAIANIQVTSGSIGVVTVTNGGSGYAVGDVLGVDLGETGKNQRFNVGIISATNSLILDRVEGEFTTSTELMTINAAGISSALTGSTPTTISNTQPWRDGLHVLVSHRNHGMHAFNNRVIISDAVGVTTTTNLAANYNSNSTASISVDSVSIFSSFENVGVSTTNPGYVKVNDEIISYTGVDAGATPPLLTGITRGLDNTTVQSHAIDDLVRKYEVAGVSLRRINTTHTFADLANNVTNGIDSYYIKLDTTSSGNGTVRDGTNSFPKLKIGSNEKNGGNKVKATGNLQFETITPNIGFMTPEDCSISARMRTVSATSVSGTEISFQDLGFEDVSFNGSTTFDTPRMIASRINEENQLTALPGNKSFTMELVLNTENTNLSPAVDVEKLSVITTTNRLDQTTTNFSDDVLVKSPFIDPNAAVYVSKRINLENPATSVQVRFDAYRDESADIRVFYRLFRLDGIDNEQPFAPFPGYENLTDTTGDGFGDKVVDLTKNNGHSDKFIAASSNYFEFRPYQYTVNDLDEFNGFQIKIIMTGTNQAYPPRIKSLSALALA